MAYIVGPTRPLHRPCLKWSQISTNAAIVSQTGGPCVCSSADNCISDTDYLICVDDVRRELITATAAASAMSSILMGVFANLPVALAPGLGINAYVSDSPCGFETF
jgi:AGZA family xanthine/uracil permease-like MFS transporter